MFQALASVPAHFWLLPLHEHILAIYENRLHPQPVALMYAARPELMIEDHQRNWLLKRMVPGR